MSHCVGKNEPYVFAGKRSESGSSHSLAAPPVEFQRDEREFQINGKERLIFTRNSGSFLPDIGCIITHFKKLI